MKTIISIIVAILTVIATIYVAGWHMFVLSIADIITQIQTEVNAVSLGLDILKILCASFVAWVMMAVGLSISKAIIE